MTTINLGVVAHADAGKTTLTEQILYFCGAVRSPGSVDKGTASTDPLPIERERGISVKTAIASVEYNGVRLNLIDAPGHADFLSEVERSLSVLDAAVLVVSGVEGIQPQTRMLLEAIRKAKLPCFLFFNKLDRPGSRWETALEEAEALLDIPCLPMTEVRGEGEDGVSVYGLFPKEAQWVEAAVLACGEEELLEEYLGGEAMEHRRVEEQVREKVSAGELCPVLCGASKFGRGTQELLEAVVRYFQPPVPLGEDLCARVFKVERDPSLGKAAYVRLFSGSLQVRQEVETREGAEKISRLRQMAGRKAEDVDGVRANECAVIYGLSSLRAGDILGKPMPGLRDYRLSEPIMLVKAEPKDPERLLELIGALRELRDEDPTLDLEWNPEKQEAWVRVLGKMELEVLEALLMERWKLRVSFGKASVIYRETPASSGTGIEAYLAPKPCWAVVKLLIEPLPRGSGFRYESRVSPGRLPYRYQAHIQTAVPRALAQGPRGWQVTDLKVTLVDGESHHVHTHPLDFFVATPMAVANGLNSTGTKLLEPMLNIQLSGPEDCLGKAIGALTNKRGRFESPEIKNGRFRLEAALPASESLNLPEEFAIATGGRGIYSSRFSHYEECPPGIGESRERLGADPLDRAKFILYARSALTEEQG